MFQERMTGAAYGKTSKYAVPNKFWALFLQTEVIRSKNDRYNQKFKYDRISPMDGAGKEIIAQHDYRHIHKIIRNQNSG